MQVVANQARTRSVVIATNGGVVCKSVWMYTIIWKLNGHVLAGPEEYVSSYASSLPISLAWRLGQLKPIYIRFDIDFFAHYRKTN